MPGERVHWLAHVPFEGLGSIQLWLAARRYTLRCSRLYAQDVLPAIHAFDWLIIMGGPMNVDDEQACPWLAAEKTLVRDAVLAGKRVLGICLGAQLMARALGAAVVKTSTPEIGWFPVKLTPGGRRSAIFQGFSPAFTAFHWHGDRFEIPGDALHAASSEVCSNQAFIYGKRAVALQFHLETTEQSAQALVEHCAHELVPAPSVQNAQAMLAEPARFADLNRMMDQLLTRLAAA